MTKTLPANQLWFQNSFVTIRVSMSDGQDGISVLEHLVPYGFSPPSHLHKTEDEVLHVLEGEFRLRVQDQEHRLGAGDLLLTPKGVRTPTALSQHREAAALQSQREGILSASCVL
jgi:uncharacterized cupin superfamily protein